jgi:hypothetical protein
MLPGIRPGTENPIMKSSFALFRRETGRKQKGDCSPNHQYSTIGTQKKYLLGHVLKQNIAGSIFIHRGATCDQDEASASAETL